MTTQELANAVGSCVLDFDPGSSYRYGTSADVLGAIVEVGFRNAFFGIPEKRTV